MFKILLADDEYLERKAFKIIIHNEIEKADIVGEACNGKEAVELNDKLDPDIIIMDIKMPIMDGLQAAEIIKKEDKNKIIIFVSAYEDFYFAQKAIKIKADDYILKPARPENLVEVIKKHIDCNKEYLINKAETLLLKNINLNDYKKSKDAIKKIIAYLEEFYNYSNVNKLRDRAKYLIDKMIISANIDEKVFSEKLNCNEILNYAFDVVRIENCMLNVLDEIFDVIMDNKLLIHNNELMFTLNYIEKNLRKDINLEDAANYINLSVSYLSKQFKKIIGVNFNKYVTKRKIEEAKNLLKDLNSSISEIAFELGYNEPNYFCKVFKTQEGITPSQYRENIHGEKNDNFV